MIFLILYNSIECHPQIRENVDTLKKIENYRISLEKKVRIYLLNFFIYIYVDLF
jgi:hypothetical protein